MKARSLLFTTLSLLVAGLLGMGVGYGLWSQTLIVNGIVQTGEVDARWLDYPLSFCHDVEAENKDVGLFTIGVDPNDDQVMQFTIDNGYPGYLVDCAVKYEIQGSIPVIMRGTGIAPGPELTNCTVIGLQTKTLTCDQLKVIFTDNIGAQLHPGDWAASNMLVQVLQPAAENATYTFSVAVCMAQWNEFATFEQCVAAAP